MVWEKMDLKTSHVTVYRGVFAQNSGRVEFKNISCYSLSGRDAKIRSSVRKFKNISCYSLSIKWWHWPKWK